MLWALIDGINDILLFEKRCTLVILSAGRIYEYITGE